MPGEKIYPVRNPALVEQMQQAYDAKLATNLQRGNDLLSSGDFKPFTGAPESMLNSAFYALLELGVESRKEIAQRVTGPMQKLATYYGVPSIFAARGDLPPHVSLDVGYLKDMTAEEIEASHEYLTSPYAHLNPLRDALTGITANLDTLVVSSNSILCASKFDETQGGPYRGRMIIERAMSKTPSQAGRNLNRNINGTVAPPYRYDDIFYVSVSRIMEPVEPGIMIAYKTAVEEEVAIPLKDEPIKITTTNLYLGKPIVFYQADAPHLIAQGQ